MNPFHLSSTIRLLTRALVVTALAVALMSGSLARVAQAQTTGPIVIDNDAIFCPSPWRIWQDCTSGSGSMNQIKQRAIDELLQAHDLPPEHAQRLLVWDRGLIRSLMFDKLLGAITKAPAERTASEQDAVNAVATRVGEKRLAAARYSRTEYDKWKTNPCGYQPPAGFTYNSTASCGSRLGGMFTSDTPPSLQEFVAYGAANQYKAWQDDPQLQQVAAFTARDLGVVLGLYSAAPGALIGGYIGAHLAAGNPVLQAIHPFIVRAVAQGLGLGLDAAAKASAGLIGAGSIGAVVAVVIFAVVTAVTQGINVFEAAKIPEKLDAAVTAAQATPDLAQVAATPEGLREIFAAFVEGTTPDNPAPVPGVPYSAPTAPVPPPGPGDRQFETLGPPNYRPEFVGSLSYLGWEQPEHRPERSVRLNDGWFVVNENGVERLSLSIDFLDPDDGKPWTAWRMGDEFLFAPAADTQTPTYVDDEFRLMQPGGLARWVTLAPRNQAPSFTAGANLSVNEDSGAYSAPWASNISSNNAVLFEQPEQEVRFELSSTVPKRCPLGCLTVGGAEQPATEPGDFLFSQQPTIDSSGRLTFTPKPNANGVATVTVRAKDSGGTAEGGRDTSDPQTFTITINPVRDPVFVPAEPATLNVTEDEARTVALGVLGVYDPDAPLLDGLQDAVSSLTTVRQPQRGTVTFDTRFGWITYTPAAEFSGTDSFRYRVCYPREPIECAEQDVNVDVIPVNDPPSFTGGGNITLPEDAAAYSALWATDISAGPGESNSVSFAVTNTNPGLFSRQPAIQGDDYFNPFAAPAGTLSFTLAPDANGTAEVTVRARELAIQGTPPSESAAQTFTITVTPINDAPSFTRGANVTVDEDAAAYRAAWATAISVGPANESTQTLEFPVSNNNPDLFIQQPTVAPDGTLSFEPASNANGSATVTVAAQDSGGTANGGQDVTDEQSFTITVNAANDRPAVPASVPTVNVLEDTPTALSLVADLGVHDTADTDWQGPEFPPVASLSTLEAPTLGTLTSDPTNGSLAFTPAPEVNGRDSFRYKVCDRGTPGTACVEQAVNVSIASVNDAPSFTKGADQIVVLNSGAQTVSNWATGFSAGPTNESSQKLSIGVENDNAALFSAQPALDANGTLSFTPAAGKVGSALVTVVLKDNGGKANGGQDTTTQTSRITVRYNFGEFAKPVEVPPTINSVTAGRTIPIRWRLTDASGAPVTDLTSVTITAPLSTSNTGGTVQEVVLNVDASSGLRNLGNGNYQYNWQPPGSYAGSFRTMLLDLGEGPAVQHRALFQFK